MPSVRLGGRGSCDQWKANCRVRIIWAGLPSRCGMLFWDWIWLDVSAGCFCRDNSGVPCFSIFWLINFFQHIRRTCCNWWVNNAKLPPKGDFEEHFGTQSPLDFFVGPMGRGWKTRILRDSSCLAVGWWVVEPMFTLWLCQNSYWKWPFIVDFPINHGDFP